MTERRLAQQNVVFFTVITSLKTLFGWVTVLTNRIMRHSRHCPCSKSAVWDWEGCGSEPCTTRRHQTFIKTDLRPYHLEFRGLVPPTVSLHHSVLVADHAAKEKGRTGEGCDGTLCHMSPATCSQSTCVKAGIRGIVK